MRLTDEQQTSVDDALYPKMQPVTDYSADPGLGVYSPSTTQPVQDYSLGFGGSPVTSYSTPDANNDGLNDTTGWAMGVVQDQSSPTGFSYNGQPTQSNGALYTAPQYGPSVQQDNAYQQSQNQYLGDSPNSGVYQDPGGNVWENGNWWNQNGEVWNDQAQSWLSPAQYNDFAQQSYDYGNAQANPQFQPNTYQQPSWWYNYDNQPALNNAPFQDPGYESPWNPDYMKNQGGGGFLSGLKDFVQPGIDAITNNPVVGAGMIAGNAFSGLLDQATGTTRQQRVNDQLSGNALIKDVTGYDASTLPYGLGYVTDAAAPVNFLGIGSTGVIGKEVAAGVLGNIGAGLAGSDAASNIPVFGAQPKALRQLEGGLIGGATGYKLAPEFGNAAEAAAKRVGAGVADVHTSEVGGISLGKKPPEIAPFESVPLEEAPLGKTGIDAILKTKGETISKPGAIGSIVGDIPGVKAVAGTLNPSVNLDRSVHLANLGDQAVRADLQTTFAGSRATLLDEIKVAFKDAPEYIGPPKNPLKGTFLDIAENPKDYVLSPQQVSVLNKIEARDMQNVNTVRSLYNADVGLKKPDTGGIYLPRINTNEDLIQQGIRTEASLSAPKIAKERVWETARARVLSDPAFKPETNPAKLISAHDQALAKLAGQQTFKEGVGGLTRMEVIDQIRPGLREARDSVRTKLETLKNQMDSAMGKENALASRARATTAQIRQIDTKMAPLEGRIAQLEADQSFGPELSYLSGELRQLRMQEAGAKRLLQGTEKAPGIQPKIAGNDVSIQRLRGQIDEVQGQLDKLTRDYKSINIPDRSGYVLNQQTYRYHPADVSQGIDKVRQTSLGPLDKLSNILETSRATTLGGDPSPVTVQGQLNLWRDPISTMVGFAKQVKDIASGEGTGLARLSREEPAMVSRFVKARGRALGTVAEEFAPERSLIAKIPKLGPKFAATENALFNGVQRLEYEAWKNTRAILKAVNPGMTDDVADFEAANALSKSVPGLNTAERGVSPARGKIERGVLTSVSFATSPALMAKDAASAVVKIAAGQRPRGREQIALVHLLTMSSTIMGVSALSAALTADSRGLSVEDAIKKTLNPANKEFAAIQLPNGWRVPIGGPFRSFVKGLAPVDRNGNLIQPDIYRWARGRVAPLPRTTMDLIQNKDYQGNAIRKGGALSQTARGLEYILEQAYLPITAGEVPAGIRQGLSPSEIGQNALSQFSGTNAQPPSAYDKRVQALGPNPTEKQVFDYNQQNGRTYSTDPKIRDQQVRADDAHVQQDARQQARDTQLEQNGMTPDNWRIWRDQRKQDNLYFAGRFDEIYKGVNFKDSNVTDVDRYNKAIADNTDRVTGDINWDAVDAATKGLNQAYIKANSNLRDSTVEKTYHANVDAIEKTGYFDRTDQNWQQVASLVPTWDKLGSPVNPKDYQSYDEWRQAALQAGLKLAGKTPSAVGTVTEIESWLDKQDPAKGMEYFGSQWRDEWTAKNPKEAYLAWQMGYYNPKKEIKDWLTSKFE